jgi:proline iminopeptidase
LLFLHGGPGAHHDYLLPQMLVLADEFELTFYDQRGGGRSKADSRETVTWQTQVGDLSLLATELIPGPLTLVGYSWGGLLAMLYAVSGLSPRVSRLVLIDPASPSRAHRREFEVALAERQASVWIANERAALAASGLRERDPDAYRQRGFELSVAGYFDDPAMAKNLTPFRVTNRVQQSIWESLGEFDVLPGLQRLGIPALVIHGRQDPIPLASSEAVASALNARLVVLDHCGHVPYVERPAQLFAAMRMFLRESAPRAAE